MSQIKTKSKKPKYKPNKKGTNESESLRKDLTQWLIFTTIYVLFLFILSGTANFYYPDPIPLGQTGLYGDVPTLVVYFGLAFWSLISVLIFKRVI